MSLNSIILGVVIRPGKQFPLVFRIFTSHKKSHYLQVTIV